MDKLKMHTPNLADDNFAALAAMFPNAVTETIDENGEVVRAVDADVLAQEINTRVVSGKEERYQFTWPDKKKSVLMANAPIAATLRPCKEESVDFDTTENLYIEGDNLDVLKLLRETYLNRVKMVYIDPPYNTGKDFIYEDDFKEETGEFLKRDGQYDEQGNRLTSNFDSNGRFHTDWLNMMYSRLRVARDLLTDDGVIFISIDDNESENLKKICNEIFGEANFISQLGWQKVYSPKNQARYFSNDYEFIICYCKSIANFSVGSLPRTPEMNARYKNPDNDPRGAWKAGDCVGSGVRKNGYYDVVSPKTGKSHNVPQGKHWVYAPETMQRLIAEDRIWFGQDGNSFPAVKQFLSEVGGRKASSLLLHTDYGHTDMAMKDLKKIFSDMEKVPFDTPKPVKLIKMLSILGLSNDDIILDFFAGSGTTAQSIIELNSEDGGKRKFVLVQIAEPIKDNDEAIKLGMNTISDVTKERIRRSGAKIKEEAGLMAQNLDTGFRVLKLDSSNMKEVYYTPEDYAQMGFNLEGFMDNIKPDRSDEDLLFQVMLDLGIPLSAKISQDGKVFYVNENYLIACFDKVDTDAITEIAKKQPYYAVFRDSSFLNDSALVNVEQVFKTYSPSTIRRVL